MRVLIINTDYPEFLRHLYESRPGLDEETYDRQLAARNDSLFGAADFYSRGFIDNGHQAAEIHANNEKLQRAWARENGLDLKPPVNFGFAGRLCDRIVRSAKSRLLGIRSKPVPHWFFKVLAAQIAAYRPDVILNQDMYLVPSRFLERHRGTAQLIAGQIAAPLPAGLDLRGYDLLVSSLPNLVAWFADRGVRSFYNPLAFDSSVLKHVTRPDKRDIDILFVGNVTGAHQSRLELLEALCRDLPIEIYGTIGPEVPAGSPLRAKAHPPVWGADMYALLARARIVLNTHIDMASEFANNLRLYEATGMGAMLVTDRKRNLADLFTPQVHVADYANSEECIEVIGHFLRHEADRARLARSGHEHTLTHHTYKARTAELAIEFQRAIEERRHDG
jgi:hypothetical protein